MSKRENHWYLLNTLVQAVGKATKPGKAHVGVWLFLVGAFVVAYKAGALSWLQQNASSPAAIIGLGLGLSVPLIAVGFVIGLVRRNSFRARYLKALSAPTSEPLLLVVEQVTSAMKALPDGDAMGAHERILACSLHGDAHGAAAALASIDWPSRAPLIQALGLSSEGVMALLCHRDARRFLDLTRLARAKATVGARVPGSSQSERYFQTCVALGEAILDLGPSGNQKWLEESAADSRYLTRQLLASLGLAIALERAGDTARAEQLRTFLRQTAPHCAPLHLKAEDFAEGASPRAPASVEDRAAAPDAGNVQERAAKQVLSTKLFKLLGFWALLLVLYALFYNLFSVKK